MKEINSEKGKEDNKNGNWKHIEKMAEKNEWREKKRREIKQHINNYKT